MANNGELERSVYSGYATKKQAKELIKSLKDSLDSSIAIDKSMGRTSSKIQIKRVMNEINAEIYWIKERYGVKQ